MNYPSSFPITPKKYLYHNICPSRISPLQHTYHAPFLLFTFLVSVIITTAYILTNIWSYDPHVRQNMRSLLLWFWMVSISTKPFSDWNPPLCGVTSGLRISGDVKGQLSRDRQNKFLLCCQAHELVQWLDHHHIPNGAILVPLYWRQALSLACL